MRGALLLALALLVAAPAGFAQTFPTKPIRIIVGTPAGGANDNAARAVASKLPDFIGQPVIVENRPGASQMIATELVAKAPPDGHTLMLATQTSLVTGPLISPPSGFDPLSDLAYVSLIGSTPLVLVVNPGQSFRSVGDVLAYARANPDKLDAGTGGAGSSQHMANELLMSMAGIRINNVAYKGEQPAVIDTIGGHLPLMFANLSTVMPQVEAGKLRPLAVTSPRPVPAAPGLPTVAEQGGLPGFEVQTWFGLVAPIATPREIVARLSADIARVLALPEVRERLASQGLTVIGGSPDEFSVFIKSEVAKWGKLIREAGIKPE